MPERENVIDDGVGRQLPREDAGETWAHEERVCLEKDMQSGHGRWRKTGAIETEGSSQTACYKLLRSVVPTSRNARGAANV